MLSNERPVGVVLRTAVNAPSVTHGDKAPSRSCKRRLHVDSITLSFVIIVLHGIFYSHSNLILALADDSAAAPAFDIGALASLASNLGSNPQIMSLVSNFLNPGGSQQKPSVSSASASGSTIQSDLNGSDLDSNSIERQISGPEPLRRGLRTSSEQATASSSAAAAAAPSQATQTTAAKSATSTTSSSSGGGGSAASSPSSSLGGLMSMLPGLMSSGSMNMASLSGLLRLNKPAASRETDVGSAPAAASAPPPPPPPAAPAVAASAPQGPAPAPVSPANAPATAQQVINSVLTAYASGQIPNDLIQLGLSGRVPPQIIELALSGQVPIEMINMVIKGQIPMQTINAFLSAIQQMQQQPASAPTSSSTGSGAAAAGGKPSTPGVFAATRALFEALFGLNNRNKDPSKPGITVPTLIGPIPLKMPSLPNVRSIGQMVGGTITNFSSMIPF